MGFCAEAVPPADLTAVSNVLLEDIVVTHNSHVSTGILGVPLLLQMLSNIGQPSLAFDLVSTKDYPGWGYMIFNDIEPATTLWELFNSPFRGPGMNSRNHIM